jgi:hypothetical protein
MGEQPKPRYPEQIVRRGEHGFIGDVDVIPARTPDDATVVGYTSGTGKREEVTTSAMSEKDTAQERGEEELGAAQSPPLAGEERDPLTGEDTSRRRTKSRQGAADK